MKATLEKGAILVAVHYERCRFTRTGSHANRWCDGYSDQPRDSCMNLISETGRRRQS